MHHTFLAWWRCITNVTTSPFTPHWLYIHMYPCVAHIWATIAYQLHRIVSFILEYELYCTSTIYRMLFLLWLVCVVNFWEGLSQSIKFYTISYIASKQSIPNFIVESSSQRKSNLMFKIWNNSWSPWRRCLQPKFRFL